MCRRAGLAMPLAAIQNPPRMTILDDERQQLMRFRDLVLAEPELHARLRAAANQQDFIALTVQLGAERGCIFSAATVETSVREQRQAWLERWL